MINNSSNNSKVFFYNDENNALEYIESREGIDNSHLIDCLKNYLDAGSTVLELGIGSGKDLDILRNTFNVIGSDNSQVFLNIYKQKNPNANLILLDAVMLNTNLKFDCIYSNKVLHHLTTKNLEKSFVRQKDLLDNDGILFHTFWFGNKKNSFENLDFIQYEPDQIISLTEKHYQIIECNYYKELLEDDSFYIILKKLK